MKKMKLFPALIAVLMLFIFTVPASATILDADKCSGPSGIGGTWDSGTSTCTVSGTVSISSDITIPAGKTLYIMSSGSINIIGISTIISNGGNISGGTIINNAGVADGGAIGSICGHSLTPITINNYGVINNNAGSIIGNCELTIINYGTINNSGTISGRTITNKCGGIINGIDENEIVQESCTSTPAEDVHDLIDDVGTLNLYQSIDNSLAAKIDAAKRALLDVNTNNNTAAINALEAFMIMSAVTAQRGKAISESDADTLIAAAQRIIDELRLMSTDLLQ